MSKAIDATLTARLTHSLKNGLLHIPETESERQCLARRLGSGTIVSPYRGLFCLANQWSELPPRRRHAILLKTLSAAHPSWTFCSFSAAVLHGLEVPFPAIRCVHIASTSSRITGSLERHHIRSDSRVLIDGIPCTGLERTAVDCIKSCRFENALGIADSLVRLAGVSNEAMIDRLASQCRKLHGLQYVADVMGHADSRSENGGESYARAVMIEQGVLLPELQVEHFDPISGRTYRDDFEWRLPSGIAAGELDGADKYGRLAMERGLSIEDVMREERQRESRLRNQGIQFARFTFQQVKLVKPFLMILDSCGIPRIQPNARIPKPR